jgi:hypothetical protein
MATGQKTKAERYRRYPWANILIYNGSTILHFTLGGVGMSLGYSLWGWVAYLLGAVYLVFAFGEMYLLMPWKICPNCVYYRWDGSRCISGLNIVSRKLAKPGKAESFAKRAKGLFCPNNLYMAALALPILALVPALIANFSWSLLIVWAAVVGLLVFRFFVVFAKLACLHCQAKFTCPQAGQMGVREL